MIMTKTRYLFFFSRPRTSVMPMGFSDFGRRLGFWAVYRTSDPIILAQFHQFWIAAIKAGGLEPSLIAAKLGIIDFPPELEHLRGYIAGFNA